MISFFRRFCRLETTTQVALVFCSHRQPFQYHPNTLSPGVQFGLDRFLQCLLVFRRQVGGVVLVISEYPNPPAPLDTDPRTMGSQRQRFVSVPGWTEGESTAHSSNQFSTRREGTRSNSRVFAVTSVRSAASACAAINRSFGPMGVPCLAR